MDGFICEFLIRPTKKRKKITHTNSNTELKHINEIAKINVRIGMINENVMILDICVDELEHC